METARWRSVVVLFVLLLCAATIDTVARAASAPQSALLTHACSASLPERLASEFESESSREQQLLLAQILPSVTSQRRIAKAELRAPVHISCQIAPFPHIRAFCEQEIDRTIANFEIKPFAQPPHLVFFDDAHQVVQVIAVAPSWTPYELRDKILSAMARA